MPDEPEVPPEEALQLMHSYLDDHYRRTLDEPIPMLDGKTLREAAAKTKERDRVRQFESQIAERDALLEQRAAAVALHEVTFQQHEATIERLHEQVRLLLARRFGASSEKLPDGQLGLFNEAEAETGEEPEADTGTEVAAHRRTAPKRVPLPDTLEWVDIEHELAESERTCPHHGVELERFAEVVSEQLDIVPAKVRVLRHIRGKYRCPRARGIFAPPRCRRSRWRRASQAPGCSRSSSRRSTSMGCRCIASSNSSGVSGWSCRARRWRGGWWGWASSWCR